ncbi:chromosome segregation protein SMC [Jeotgalibacillus haloalkalitolerans]|uniref:Chromosome partition protein Smc n=1 Tax=Jeotgalibacillus haloalkalitolerans TaxID=3104292 RepID=A0ABU5KLU5_9BACL|nr:chromosome segregation protein SMC [Jeotgalibacillus sp. HH7-29]MDZ5711690.1 chromosome segregation protein SMC [Jeotgalibacillus sp. HH7-29]
MYVKQLEVLGFKSFAEKVQIDFVPGVTAVVGPNGSGKSNITEAIRWVLGEQSAKSLRGGKMEDVIFSGSDSRKQLNFAEVSLVLDNTDGALPLDYAEVSVTRRVFRTGDSEYLLNGSACRLKDITELFIDSGLGKEAFSIIGQGRVDQILNSKPEERRVILEEAAGVLKYKGRRKKADQRLDETQDNLYRVQDILHELSAQVEPLKQQASLAREYLAYKDDLKKTESGLLAYEAEEMTAEWESKEAELIRVKEHEQKLRLKLDEDDEALNAKQKERSVCEKSIEELQSTLLTVTKEAEQLEGRRQVLIERQKNADQNEDQLKQKVKDLNDQLIKVTERITQKEQVAEEVKKDIAQIKKQIAETDSVLGTSIDQIEQDLERAKNDYFETLNNKTTIQNELNYLNQQRDQEHKRAEKLTGTNARYIEEREKWNEKHEKLNAKAEEITDELTATAADYKTAVKKRDDIRAELADLEKNLYKAYQFVSEAKSRKSMLESMEEEFSGFYQGVKEVLKNRGGKLKGIEGAVAELIDVPKEYETAVETALGASMQSIVTGNEADARQAIQFLKQSRAGRATFLPMSVIKSRTLPESLITRASEHDDFISAASDLVAFDSKYKQVIENLLGHVVVVKSLKGANELAKILQYRYRIVTLEGDIVNPGGSMSGGSQAKKTSSIFSRKNELDQLSSQIPNYEETAVKLEQKVQSLKNQAAEFEHEMDTHRMKGEQLRVKEAELKADLREVETAIRQADEQLKLYDLEMAEFTHSKGSFEDKAVELQRHAAEAEMQLAELDQMIKNLTKQRETQQSSKDEMVEVKSGLQARLAVAEEKASQIRRELRESELLKTEINEKYERSKEDLKWLTEEMSSGEGQADQLHSQIQTKQDESLALSKKLNDIKQQREALEIELQELTASYKESSRIHHGLLEQINELKLSAGKLSSDIDYRLNKLQEEYELSFHAAKEEYPLQMEPADARSKVKLIKLSISELGHVNIGAIEEYDRVSERYEFLLDQQNDLQEAKENLLSVIEEMDAEMSRRFSDTFHQVKEHFSSVFQKLFGGGHAELKLTNPDDMLSTGIDIVAQPPGKKLQNLSLLSGGERALTAIALLFSILHVRPVPFCILDEVEAALDEANVQRFSDYLHQFSEQSQFIVITHRKGTMEGADVLYGVTMQESGVSKLVSVKLEEQINMN